MLTVLNARRTAQRVLIAALFCGAAAVSAIGVSQVSAQTEAPLMQTASLEVPAAIEGEQASVETAVKSFVSAMAQGDAQAIWMFASEEEQEAFATEDAVFAAFADAFPALTQAKTVSVDDVTQEGDMPFVQVTFADAQGSTSQANVGLWLDDAGDWKVVSCEITSVSDRVASL